MASAKTPEIALVGQPNAGKSTVFNVLSDIKTHVSNFSGTSVDVADSRIDVYGKTYHIIDLPGVYSLNPGDEAEKVTLDYLINRPLDLIINVVDASMLSRSLELTVELMEFGTPMVVALNMWDEAERKGIKVYPEKLQKLLGIPVVTTSALYGKGIKELVETCRNALNGEGKAANAQPVALSYTSHIEESVCTIEEAFKSQEISRNGSPRFYAIKALETPEIVPQEILGLVMAPLEAIRCEIQEMHRKDNHETISYERHHLAMKLMEEVSHFVDRKSIPLREKADRYFLHPLLGYFPLLLFFFLFFTVIYVVGNFLGSLAGIPLGKIQGLYLDLKSTSPFLFYTIDGVYQGIEGALGIVLPYFLPLIFLTSFFEDTGYLARIAFLLDGAMHKIGLHGKSVAPFVLGFGCTVPAMYSIRIIEQKRERDLTAILLPFIPCTARTSVILAVTAAFTGPMGAVLVYGIIILVIGLAGRGMTIAMGKPMGLVMEIPDLKVPSLQVSFSKTWLKMKNFLKFAVPFLVLGSILMGWLEFFQVNDVVNRLFSPLVNTVMGLDDRLGSTLVYGFFRKELVVVMANSAFGLDGLSNWPMTKAQILVFVVFVALYFPCFSSFVVMWKEFGKKVVFSSALLSIVVATTAAFLLRLVL